MLAVLNGLVLTAFLMLFAYRERDYGSMKPIYLFPAVLPFMACCATGFERLWTNGPRLLSGIATKCATALCIAYLADELALFVQLSALRLHLG